MVCFQVNGPGSNPGENSSLDNEFPELDEFHLQY